MSEWESGYVGDALIVAGYRRTQDQDELLSQITQLGQVLIASGQPWRIRRLAPSVPERDVPSRPNVRREIGALFGRASTARLLVIIGDLTWTIEGVGLICSPDASAFREDVSVPLEWIGDRLRRSPAITSVVLLAARGEPQDPARWMELLGAGSAEHLVLATGGDGVSEVRALVDGLTTEGMDPETGTVTLRSLGRHLAGRITAPPARVPASTSTILIPSAFERPDLPTRIDRLRAAEDPADLVGATLPGRFRIEAEIARGSFGIVYRAHQELIGRDVAVKVLPPGISSDAARLFLEEIRIIGRLDHRNIVRVHHADVTPGGRMFIAMELLQGKTLQQLLDHHDALPSVRALQIAQDLLDALSAAHARNVIHADIKPENIIITEGANGRAVLVDFGLARLRASAPATSIGGTVAFMAPEQKNEGRVDTTSDLYAAGLVIASMFIARSKLTERALAELVSDVEDEQVRSVVARAVALTPEDRFASAEDMAAALSGRAVGVPARARRPPFRHVAPFDETGRDEFYGRDREINAVLEHVIFRRVVVYVAPSGTGKTSLLRAGLIPRLAELGIRAIYVACRSGLPNGIAARIDASASTIAEAIARHHEASRQRLVLVIDQVEAALLASTSTLIDDLGIPSWPADAEVSVVLSVREEYLARLLERVQRVEPGAPVVRLGPLSPGAARAALVQTLANRSLTIEPALLDALLEDLTRAVASLYVEMGWRDDLAIYPPHLQLAGAVLYESLPTGETEISLTLYQRLGGLATILGEHLHHVLEGELVPQDTVIAKDLLLALATTGTARTARAEAELVAIGCRSTQTHSDDRSDRTPETVMRVIGFLRDRGLLVSIAGREGQIYWDLAHDSLVDKIRQWITSTDLARLRALELVRYHLRRSRPELPSLLAADEIREIRMHLGEGDLDDLDAEWARPDRAPRPAHQLVGASRSAIRARRTALLSLGLVPVLAAVIFGSRWWEERKLNQLRDRDIGTFSLELSVFDWDATRLTATDASDGVAGLSWELRKPDAEDEDVPGKPFPTGDFSATELAGNARTRAYRVSARGGPAVLVIRRATSRHGVPCREVVIPIRKLPGFSSNGQAAPMPVRFAVRIPSCQATRAGMIEIPSGTYVAGGLGDPPGVFAPGEVTPEDPQRYVPTYWIDRTEVTLAAIGVYFEMAALHRFVAPPRPNTEQLEGTDQPPYPAIAITWREARAYCRYLGKDLPTLDQWDKALRGGPVVDGAPNPCPRRNFSRCGDIENSAANVRVGDLARPAPVTAHPGDSSPFGILGMVGSAQEWTRSFAAPRNHLTTLWPELRRFFHHVPSPFVITRGCNWSDIECSTAPLTMMPIENERARDTRLFSFGFRCAISLMNHAGSAAVADDAPGRPPDRTADPRMSGRLRTE